MNPSQTSPFVVPARHEALVPQGLFLFLARLASPVVTYRFHIVFAPFLPLQGPYVEV
jgi:hypothetical protein